MASLRPLANRDILFAQEYVRVNGSENEDARDRQWFYTYNHSIEHPYFGSRPGFVRAKMMYQGLVGVVEDEHKTRLTWLLNLDFGGMVPHSFTSALVVSLMNFPIEIVEDTKKYLHEKQGGEMTDIEKSTSSQGDHGHALAGASHEEALKELQEKLKRSEKRIEELKRKETKSSLLRQRIKSLVEEEAEVELPVLRRRLKRALNDEVEEQEES